MGISEFFAYVSTKLDYILSVSVAGFSLKFVAISAFIASCGVSLIRKRSNH